MIKIAVFGHSPDAFSDPQAVLRNIDNAIAVVKHQHTQKDFLFNLNCEPGVGQWFAAALMEQDVPYEIYLSSSPDEVIQYWSEEEQERFVWQSSKAKAIHVFGKDNSTESRISRDKKMIDDAQWILVFWNGKHQGNTYRAIEYAINNNKIVYDGKGELRIIDGSALKVGEWF